MRGDDPVPAGARQVMVELRLVRKLPGLQPRQAMCPETVAEYAELYSGGAELPPLVLFTAPGRPRDDLLAGGWHRFDGACRAGRRSLPAWVATGTEEDAQLYCAGTNAAHGLKRTRADKRRAVHMVLAHPGGKGWTDQQVADHCGVSLHLVRALRRAGAWQPPVGLFGPLTDEAPPAGEYGEEAVDRAEVDGAAEDRARLWSRAWRLWRKACRYAAALGLSPEALVQWLLTAPAGEMRAEGAAPAPAEAPAAPPEGPAP